MSYESEIVVLSKKLVERKYPSGSDYLFWCDGCKSVHHFSVGNHRSVSWQFDGNKDQPTFSPSLRYIKHDRAGADVGSYCHLFLRKGMIEFLGDCPHDMKGRTVVMVDLPVDKNYYFDERLLAALKAFRNE